jgi:hypothetical protein
MVGIPSFEIQKNVVLIFCSGKLVTNKLSRWIQTIYRIAFRNSKENSYIYIGHIALYVEYHFYFIK